LVGSSSSRDVRLLEQQAAERDAAPLAAGEHVHQRVARRAAQRVHRQFQAAVQVPGVERIEAVLHLGLAVHQRLHLVGVQRLGEARIDLVELAQRVHHLLHTFFDDLAHGLARGELRLLLQIADGVAGRQHRFADEVLLHAGHDAQQRAFACAVQPQHADLGAVEIGEADVAQHLLLGRVDFADPHHRINDLCTHGFGLFGWRIWLRIDGATIARKGAKAQRSGGAFVTSVGVVAIASATIREVASANRAFRNFRVFRVPHPCVSNVIWLASLAHLTVALRRLARPTAPPVPRAS
jgi:hypothetical protein